MKPTKKELIKKYGAKVVNDWDEGVIVDELYDEYEEIKKTNKKLIEFDPSSNKPFMVYFYEDGGWQCYSGEDSLDDARNVWMNKK